MVDATERQPTDSSPFSRQDFFDSIAKLEECIKLQIQESFQSFIAQFDQMKVTIAQATATADAAFELAMATQDDVRRLDIADDWARNKIMLLKNKEHNLKFRRFFEDIDPSPDLSSFLLTWLAGALGLELGVAPVIDKAYRFGLANKWNSQYPCDILASFPDSRTRKAILKKSRSKEGLIFQGKRIIVLLDLSSEILLCRKALKPIISKLLEHKIKFKWFSPTSFFILHQGQRLQVTDVDSGYLLLDTLQITYEKLDLSDPALVPPPKEECSQWNKSKKW